MGRVTFRVGPDLADTSDPRRVFAPGNWQQLDDDDLDLGGVTPIPLGPPGSQMPLLLALGKDGNAYLLNREDLGGVGGAVPAYRAARGEIITAPAVYQMGGAIRVAYQARGLALAQAEPTYRASARSRSPQIPPYGYPLLGALGWTAGAPPLSQQQTEHLNRLSGLPARRAMTDCTASAAIPVTRYTEGEVRVMA